MWWNHMYGWSGWLAMSLTMVIAYGGLALIIVLALRDEFMPRPRPADPKQVLDARLARGEIDPKEYRDRITALSEVGHA